jgi:hypothetical protein
VLAPFLENKVQKRIKYKLYYYFEREEFVIDMSN